MTQEDKLSKINEGRTAAVMLQWLVPILQEEEKRIIISLKTCFRTGKHTELVMASHVAQLCSIEDLKYKLESMTRVGEASYQEIKGQGEEHGYEHSVEGTDDWRSS